MIFSRFDKHEIYLCRLNLSLHSSLYHWYVGVHFRWQLSQIIHKRMNVWYGSAAVNYDSISMLQAYVNQALCIRGLAER